MPRRRQSSRLLRASRLLRGPGSLSYDHDRLAAAITGMPVITATDAAANGLSDFSESVIMMIAPARDPMIRPAAANLKFQILFPSSQSAPFRPWSLRP